MSLTDAERRLIAAGWSSASCDQATYAAKYGVSARTLRSWLERYAVGDRPVAKARVIIERAIGELLDLRAALDAEEACRNGGGQVQSDDGMPGRKNGSEAEGATSAVPKTALAPKAMPPAGYFAGL